MSWRKAKQEQQTTQITHIAVTPGKMEQGVPMQTQTAPSAYPAPGAAYSQPPISNQPGSSQAPTAPYAQTPQSYEQSSAYPVQAMPPSHELPAHQPVLVRLRSLSVR